MSKEILVAIKNVETKLKKLEAKFYSDRSLLWDSLDALQNQLRKQCKHSNVKFESSWNCHNNVEDGEYVCQDCRKFVTKVEKYV